MADAEEDVVASIVRLWPWKETATEKEESEVEVIEMIDQFRGMLMEGMLMKVWLKWSSSCDHQSVRPMGP